MFVTGGVLATGISLAVIHKTAIIGLCLAHPVAALAVAAVALTTLVVSAMMLCQKKSPYEKVSAPSDSTESGTRPFTDPKEDLFSNRWLCCF